MLPANFGDWHGSLRRRTSSAVDLAFGEFAKDLAGACRIILEHDDSWRSCPAQAESAAQRSLKLLTLDPSADSGVFKRALNESGLNAVLRPIDFHEP